MSGGQQQPDTTSQGLIVHLPSSPLAPQRKDESAVTFHYGIFLESPHFIVVVVNLLLCLIYQLHFITGVGTNTVYTGLRTIRSSTQGLGPHPPKIGGDDRISQQGKKWL